MKKVLIISYYWPPSGGAGVQRWLKFAKYLPEYGVEPFVLTVDARYATYPQTDNSLEKEVPDQLKVFRTKSFEPLGIISRIMGKDKIPYGGFSNVNKRGFIQTVLRFIRGNFFIPDARMGWNKYAISEAAEIIRRYGISTVITTGPPHSTHLAGLKIKKKATVKWIADFRDPWTDIYYYSDMLHTPLAKMIDRRKERAVLDGADVVIANCNTNRDLLLSKVLGGNPGKFIVITNGFDEDDFTESGSPEKEFVITYSGTMSDQYKPQVFFNALNRVIKNNPDIRIRFRIAGNISSSAERQIKESGIHDNFEYPGYVDHSVLVEFLSASTALLYIFPEAKHEKGVAGKLFEYLAVSRPIIAIGPADSDAAAIIDECDAGKTFSRNDEQGLVKYLEHLVELYRTNPDLAAGNGKHLNYSRKRLTAKLSEIIVD